MTRWQSNAEIEAQMDHAERIGSRFTMPMVCSLCQIVYAFKDGEGVRGCSHGVCDPCAPLYLAEMGVLDVGLGFEEERRPSLVMDTMRVLGGLGVAAVGSAAFLLLLIAIEDLIGR